MICRKIFGNLLEHTKICRRRSEQVKSISLKKESQSPNVSSLSRRSLRIKQETKKKCPNCGYLHQNLDEHLKNCKKETQIQCPFCTYTTKYKSELKIHLPIHLSKNLMFSLKNKEQEEQDTEESKGNFNFLLNFQAYLNRF